MKRNNKGQFFKGGNVKEEHPLWKGDNASYYAIHIWLGLNYGKANKCEDKDCLGKSNKFEYALKKGFSHSHNRENYITLCVFCHRNYDKINIGSKSHLWKGGKPKCLDCPNILSRRFNKTMLCIKCKNKKYPSRKICISQEV